MRRLLSVAMVLGLLLALPLATEARSRSRSSEVDVAVTEVNAPSTAGVGQNVTIEVTITATGGRATSADIELAVSPGGDTQQQEITIRDGETETVGFSWTPDSAGTYTATATAETGDDPDTSNDSVTAEIDVLSGDALIVSDLSADVEGTNQISGSVELASGAVSNSHTRRRGGGVSNAGVTIEYTTPDGRAGSTTVTTNSSGVANFEFLVEGNGSVPNCYTVTVTDVEAPDAEYSASDAASTTVYPEPTALYTTDGDNGMTRVDLNGNGPENVNSIDAYEGVVTTLDGQVFAINSDNESIDIFDADLNQTGSFVLQDEDDASGLAIDSEGVLYVAHEDGTDAVVKYDQQGNVLGSWEEDLLDDGDDLDIGPDGLVYVAEGDAPNNIKVFGKDGNLERSFTTVEDNDADDVTFDCAGNLYVTTNEGVEVFNTDGTFQRAIGSDELSAPESILVGGAEQHIYVTEDEDGIAVFNQDGNLVETITGDFEPNDIAFGF